MMCGGEAVQHKVLGYQEWVEILMITLVSSQKSLPPKACQDESNPSAKCGPGDLGFWASLFDILKDIFGFIFGFFDF